MKTAVITTVHGRGDHLRRQLEGMSTSTAPPDLHIVVALGDPAVTDIVGTSAVVLDCPAAQPLPVAMGRNLGAAAAVRNAAELLVFLDVDCIPGADLIDRYHTIARRPEHENALLCGPVTYLEPPGPRGYVISEIRAKPNPHPARPAPQDGTVAATTDYSLFWSLSVDSASGTAATAVKTPTLRNTPRPGTCRCDGSVGRTHFTSTTPSPTRPWTTSTTSCATPRSFTNGGDGGPWKAGCPPLRPKA
jgi:hypothetical protein